MSHDSFLALLAFAFVSSITPGPNNFMLLSSGVNFGFARSVPHILGIGAGFFSLLLAIGLGLGALLTAYPSLNVALKVLGGGYLLYLAWKIGTSRTMGTAKENRAEPLTFFQAALFQWVNPKAWVIGVSAMAIYTNPVDPFWSVMIIAVSFSIVNLPSLSTWTGFGVALRGFLADPVKLKWFNITMGILLAATLWPMLR
ncbi:LysE family translocator [Tianweitania sediminis]|jgi:threonine/homoserine/homoserine lactone efflux protein|uniref:LysE family translocator n=1 Tax=Tianweitania sediminis TaxID=1502156 RepID=A0A8J7R6Y3_9HYPH|nr:LysE family translocator [Tianweitania sediminis]MBP0439152.1 LysE family translocator [Tianweitania sediminis]HEV7418180.1 LysE family translocator [Tianweitania sediminis]